MTCLTAHDIPVRQPDRTALPTIRVPVEVVQWTLSTSDVICMMALRTTITGPIAIAEIHRRTAHLFTRSAVEAALLRLIREGTLRTLNYGPKHGEGIKYQGEIWEVVAP